LWDLTTKNMKKNLAFYGDFSGLNRMLCGFSEMYGDLMGMLIECCGDI
jgi:hypothetical protein